MLRPYQRDGISWIASRDRCVLADDVGLGKTVQAIGSTETRYAGRPMRAIVLAPAGLIEHWGRELSRWAISPWRVLLGSDRYLGSLGWYVASFDTVKQPGRLRDSLLRASFDAVIVDEAHRVKNPTTARASTVKAIVSRAESCTLLTATPVRRSAVDDLAGYLDLLHVDCRGGDSVKTASRLTLRRTRGDVLPWLPACTIAHVTTYAPEHRIRSLGDLQRARHELACAKTPESLAIAREILGSGHRCVIWSCYLEPLRTLARALPSALVLDGSVPPVARGRLLDTFRRSARPIALLAQLETGGEGIDLTAASYGIVNDLPWIPAALDQAIGRLHRPGAPSPVHVTIVHGGRLDAVVWRNIERIRIDTLGFMRQLDARSILAEVMDTM